MRRGEAKRSTPNTRTRSDGEIDEQTRTDSGQTAVSSACEQNIDDALNRQLHMQHGMGMQFESVDSIPTQCFERFFILVGFARSCVVAATVLTFETDRSFCAKTSAMNRKSM